MATLVPSPEIEEISKRNMKLKKFHRETPSMVARDAEAWGPDCVFL